MSKNNRLNVDMKIYSTYKDALLDQNGWKACNYDDRGVGFPRDCGPTGLVAFQWNSWKRDPNRKATFCIERFVRMCLIFFHSKSHIFMFFSEKMEF